MGARADLRARLTALGLVALAATTLVGASSVSSAPGDTLRVSLTTSGAQANGDSSAASLSGDARYVAFTSTASNLVAGDTNSAADVFVRDRTAGTTRRISVATGGGQADADSFEAAISRDGSAVVFTSRATNLVAGDTNGVTDIFVHDLASGATARVSRTMSGGETNFSSVAPDISGSGRYVVYSSSANNIFPGDANSAADVFLFDRSLGTTEHVSLSSAGGMSGVGEENNEPAISDDGRLVAFQVSAPAPSFAPGLDPTDDNNVTDIYVRDRAAGTTRRVSLSTAGADGDLASRDVTISGNGTWVAYTSSASTLVPGDTNGDPDVFGTNVVTGETQRVSVATGGAEASGGSSNAAISFDGNFIAFESAGGNLGVGDTNSVRDVFVHDRATGKTTRESLSAVGTQVAAASGAPDISTDGQIISFQSGAGDLVSGDTNSRNDIFVHELGLADQTAPTVTGTPDRAPNADGWYAGDVTIDWTAVDPGLSSGPPTDPPNTIAGTEGRNVVYTSAPSCDPNNNCGTGSLTLSIDKTAPSITSAATIANANGWYREDVVVAFACADGLSGILTCPTPAVVSTEGASNSVTGTAVDRAGNSGSTTRSGIQLDKTPPVVTFTGGGTYDISDTVTIECTATDALSGIDTESCPDVVGPGYLFPAGVNTVVGTATDKAENTGSASVTFTIAISGSSVGALACQFLGSSGHARAVCRKLTRLALDAQAAKDRGDTRARDKAIKEFQQTASKESGKLFTADQVAILTRAIAGLAA